MFNFEDEILVFSVDNNEVKIGPFSGNYFAEEKHNVVGDAMYEDSFNEYHFRSLLMVSKAISELEGIPLYATHQSGGIAYEAWHGSSFYGYYTVFSDYAYLDSIDAVAYGTLKKKLRA